MKSGYVVTVQGQYFIRAGEKQKALKWYKFKINLPTMDCALSIIKNKVLNVVLPKLYSDYDGFRTHDIINVTAFGNIAQAKAVLWQMNRSTIISYIQEQELPVIVDIYETLMELRQAVEMAEADLDRFIRVQEEKEKDHKFMKQLRELNPELYAKPDEDEFGQPKEKPIVANCPPVTDPAPPAPAPDYEVPTPTSEQKKEFDDVLALLG